MSAQAEPVLASTVPDTDLDHFICCDLELAEGTSCRALCGAPATYEAATADAVGCVVCSDLDAGNHCDYQLDGRCLYPHVADA